MIKKWEIEMIPGDSGGFFCSKGWEHLSVVFCDQFAEAKMDLNDPGVPSLGIRTLEPSAWNGVKM